MDLQDREIFQSIILDHDGQPRNFRTLDDPTHSADGYNPICGDRYRVYLSVADGRITEITFGGYGCAISKASASMMTTVLKGRNVSDAVRLFDVFSRLLAGEEGVSKEQLGELVALEGVRRWPARIKCATLAWHATMAALEGREKASTE